MKSTTYIAEITERIKNKKRMKSICLNSQKSENTQTSNVNCQFFSKTCLQHDTSLQLLGIHDLSAFYSTLLSFFCSEDIWI